MNVYNKIGFIINQHDVVHHYLNIWEYLDKDEFEIIVFGDEDRIIEFCSDKFNYRLYQDVLNEKIVYKYLVSHQFIGYVDGEEEKGYLLKRIGLINIRLMYALGKNNWHFAEWNNIYDLIFCFGPYQVEMLAKYQRPVSMAVGYPRYDKYYNRNQSVQKIKTDLKCDPENATIVWLPTHGELSSIDDFAEEISQLTKQYNVIAKPHPGTLLSDNERLEKLRNLNFTYLIENPFDNINLYLIADTVISDYGGIAFSALYLDKNILLLNLPNAMADKNIQYDSSDIDIRSKIINIDSSGDKRILDLLKNEKVWKEQKEIREELRVKYFTPNYGNSAEIVADKIKQIDSILVDRLKRNITDDEQVKIETAEQLIEHGRHDAAEDILQNVLIINPTSEYAMIDLSVSKILNGEFLEAEKLLKKVLELNPQNDSAIENLNYLYERGFVEI